MTSLSNLGLKLLDSSPRGAEVEDCAQLHFGHGECRTRSILADAGEAVVLVQFISQIKLGPGPSVVPLGSLNPAILWLQCTHPRDQAR